MKETNIEQQLMHEFAEFIETDPVAPDEQLSESILNLVEKDLRPARWKVYSKFTLVEVAAGLATLTICPQFGLAFGQHYEFLDAFQTATPPLAFYLLCGLFFVIFGAALSGLVLSRDEIRIVGNSKYLYFAAYSFLAYFCLVSLGSEALAAGTLTWILGAMLGNVIGFETIIRLRQTAS